MAMCVRFGSCRLPLMPDLAFLLPVALVVALQVWLCRRKKPLAGADSAGAELPVQPAAGVQLGAFGLMQPGSGGATLEENGQVVQQTVTENGMITVYDGEGNIVEQYPDPNAQERQRSGECPDPVLSVGLLFLVGNIPTVVLGGIWLHYKNRRDFQDELRKMNIQDLG